jgi:O-acetyl-ADP-ribose deacetylase (regulator of RNase III)
MNNLMAKIEILKGNLLESSELLICHQVNCQGTMGAGLARQIKQKYPIVFRQYKKLCDKYQAEDLLGNCQPVLVDDYKVVVNLFGQLHYGRDKKYTDYKALAKSLEQLKYLLKFVDPYIHHDTIALPYGLGCGLAGGNWGTVFKIIIKVFEDWDGYINIYQL